jgi:hypothetical protein
LLIVRNETEEGDKWDINPIEEKYGNYPFQVEYVTVSVIHAERL